MVTRRVENYKAELQDRQEVELFGWHAERYLTQVSQPRNKRLRHITRDWKIFNDVPIQEIGQRQIAISDLSEFKPLHTFDGRGDGAKDAGAEDEVR